MSDEWVIPHLFKVQTAAINWPDEAGALGFEGTFLETGMDAGFLNFRWMLHPSLGLPLFPFTIWHMPDPGGDLDAQELADMSGWEAIEMAGLPVDDAWGDTGYSTGNQGPVDNPAPPMSGTLSPFEAALRRLRLGAPRIGWAGLTLDGISLDEWASPDLESYLLEMAGDPPRSPLLRGIQAMLRDRPNALEHAKYVIPAGESAGQDELQPHLMANGASPLGGQDRPARGEWGPLGLLLVAAGTDPLAALALGFGAALNTSGEELYKVTVQHRLTFGEVDFDFLLADVVSINRQLRAPNPPAGLKARLIGGNRPQVVDGPSLQSIGVSWDRPENPRHTPQPEDPFPASYAIGRFGPHPVQAEILLARRENLDGWQPYVASKPEQVRPVLFTDHILRLSTIGGQPFADPHGLELTYAVAAQDIFGRWSQWSTIPFQSEGEPPQAPSILSVTVDPSGKADIDFAWDWSDRSPEFVAMIGAFQDDPGNFLLSGRVQFGGEAEPQPGGLQVIPLDPDRQPAAGWGEAQDRDPTQPEVRFYRLSVQIPLDFAGLTERVFQVQAQGQRRLHKVWGAASHHPDFNVSPFGPPYNVRLYDPAPPPAPVVPEAPQWASLRDPAGVSRIQLTWRGDPRADGYVLYEATETALLAALGLPGPDTSKPFTDRLAVLRGANLPALRNIFRRVQKDLIPPGTPETVYEAALPRGSTVIHFYAVTAMSRNQVESAWPDSSKKFIAVAAPRLAVPAPPALQAETDPAQPAVQLRIGLGQGPAVSQVELYRAGKEELAQSADTMGPPLATLPAAGAEIAFTDNTLAPGWRRRWYRAVAWSARDDQRGLVEARSPASPAVSVLLLPQHPPDISDLRSNEPGSGSAEDLISWTSQAPIQVTPLGPHAVVVEAHGTSGQIARLEGNLDALPAVNSLAELPPPNPADRRIIRVGPPEGYRLYAWLPRPADLVLRATVKMIDPLGRMSSQTEDVIPIAVLFVPVPDLIGEDLDQALQELVDLGLVPVVDDTVLLADRQNAVVESLVPAVGESVEAGTQILVTPVDRPLVEVPDVRNLSLAEAKQKLEAAGLVPEEALVALADFSTAVVDFTEPAQGIPVNPGSTVVIFLKDSI